MTDQLALVKVDGLPVVPLTTEQARELTDRIKATVEQAWALLLEAHERQAWKALGYETWEEYVRGEFHMARRTSYQLLDQGRVIRAIGDAAGGVRHGAQISEREARDIKSVLPEVTEVVRERVAELPEPNPERVQEIVREEVAKAREVARERQERRAEDREFLERHQPPGFDAAADGELVRQRGALSRLTEDIVALGDPAEFAATHRGKLRDAHIARVEAAICWLDDFLVAWRDA